MKISFFPLNRLLIATVAGISAASLLGQQPSLAQLNQVDKPSGFESLDNGPCANAAQDGSFNVLNLMNCAQLSGGTNWNAAQPGQGLDAEVQKFLQEAQQQQAKPNTGVSNPLEAQQQQAKPNTGVSNPSNGQVVFPVTKPEQGN